MAYPPEPLIVSSRGKRVAEAPFTPPEGISRRAEVDDCDDLLLGSFSIHPEFLRAHWCVSEYWRPVMGRPNALTQQAHGQPSGLT